MTLDRLRPSIADVAAIMVAPAFPDLVAGLVLRGANHGLGPAVDRAALVSCCIDAIHRGRDPSTMRPGPDWIAIAAMVVMAHARGILRPHLYPMADDAATACGLVGIDPAALAVAGSEGDPAMIRVRARPDGTIAVEHG